MISQQHMLCGDEVKAVVADIGSSHCKFGTAGQDVPRHTFRSEIGSRTDKNDSKQRFVFGSSGFRFLYDDLEVHSLQSNNESKWDHVAQLIRHGVSDQMKVNPQDYPIMFARNQIINGPESANKMMEICLESESFPAMYMASSGSLSAFSAGRPTSLVINLGASGTSILPVVDGYELSKASLFTSRGGNTLDTMILEETQRILKSSITPWYEKKNSTSTTDGVVSSVTKSTTASFRQMHIYDTARDIKHWMCFIPHKPLPNSERAEFYTNTYKMPPSYELPDGTMLPSSDSLCTIPERLFFANSASGIDKPAMESVLRKRCRDLLLYDDLQQQQSQSQSQQMTTSSPASPSVAPLDVNMDTLTTLVYTSISKCDVDVRKDLLGHIQLVGGGALMEGISQRLANELSEVVPSHMKVRMLSALPMERQNAAWIGGSVLSICGSFQQRWLSRAEYEEQGPLRSASRFDH